MFTNSWSCNIPFHKIWLLTNFSYLQHRGCDLWTLRPCRCSRTHSCPPGPGRYPPLSCCSPSRHHKGEGCSPHYKKEYKCMTGYKIFLFMPASIVHVQNGKIISNLCFNDIFFKIRIWVSNDVYIKLWDVIHSMTSTTKSPLQLWHVCPITST